MERRRRCAVHNCKISSRKRRMLHFPSDVTRFKAWVAFCQNPALSSTLTTSYYLCADHLDSKYFIGGNRNSMLIKGCHAVPSLCGPGVLPGNLSPAVNTKRYGYCSVPGCTSSAKVVRFPRFEDPRYEAWVSFCKTPKATRAKSMYICVDHFELKHFYNGSRTQNLLRASRPIPTLNGPTDSSSVDGKEFSEDEGDYQYWIVITAAD